jgi:hypothetical protein
LGVDAVEQVGVEPFEHDIHGRQLLFSKFTENSPRGKGRFCWERGKLHVRLRGSDRKLRGIAGISKQRREIRERAEKSFGCR